MGVVSSKIAIFAYIFRNFIYETKIIMSEYVVPNGFSSTLKRLTLNSHFALNTVSECEWNRLARMLWF